MIQIVDDKVVDNNTQIKFFNMIPTNNKIVKTYSEADHDWIWYDVCATIAQDLADWIKL